ncbi:hypothetical protein SAMN05443247_06520 [Bradyrhizobium erythrophlei]|nr:hypothetical protein SAMN05443247_06520 [Bradyrhizobium erythrophlei]
MPHNNTAIIDEATEQLAEYFGAILVDDTIDQPAAMTKLFKQFGDYLKANVTDDVTGDHQGDTDKKLSDRLNEIVAEMIVAAPSLHPQRARRWLLHTPQGQKLLAQYSTMKKDPPMLDIAKIVSITEEALLAGVTKRDGESYAKSFSRRYETDIDFRKQWAALTEAKHLLSMASTTKSMATLTPTSTEVGNTSVSDDSAEAVRLLQEMADKQHRTFEQVFSDPANRELAARTYTAAHRPTASSTSGSELQR